MSAIPYPRPIAGGPTDARPILVRHAESIWGKVDRKRDELFVTLQRAAALESHDLLVIKSGPFVQPAWVKVEAWVPRDDRLVTERASATVYIQAHEFYQFPIVYRVALEGRGAARTVGPLKAFDLEQAHQLLQYVLGRGPEPSVRALLLRRKRWEFWRPENHVNVFRPDWLAFAPPALLFLAFFAVRWSSLLSLLLLVAALGGWVYLAARPVVVRSAGCPDGDPRLLRRADAWQTVVDGLGDAVPALRAQLLTAFQQAPPPGLRSNAEQIWHWGLDGIEDREQLVLALGRAACFVHLHAYGDLLYVGWDAHLNQGRWVEHVLASGLDRKTGAPSEVRTVVTGVQPLTEYDLTDLNCLTEWTHAKVVQEVKRLAADRAIDQEINFDIQRGDRQQLTRPEGGRGQEGSGGLLNRLASAFVRAE